MASSDVYAPAPLGGTSKDDSNILAAITGNPGKVVYLQSGAVYQINSLRLPSNTTLDLNGSELRQVNPTGQGGGGACLRNENQTEAITSNSNIWVRNGRISVGSNSSGRPVSFQGVTRLRLTDLVVEKRTDAIFADFMVNIRCADDVTVDRLKITGGTAIGEDGLHIGSITRANISNITVDSGDDALVIVHQFNVKRASSQINVTNAVLRSASANIIRIGVYAGETFGISGVNLANISGDLAPGNASAGVKFHDDTLTGMVRDIAWTGGNLDLTNQTSTNAAITCSGVITSTFSSVRVKGGTGKAFDLNACQYLSLIDCHARPRTGSTVVNSLFQIGASKWITLTGCSATGSLNHGFAVDGAGSADIGFLFCRATSSAGQNFRLKYVTGARLIGCLSVGSQNGVQCDTTNPPSGVLLMGSEVRGASSALTAGTRTVGNIGVTDR